MTGPARLQGAVDALRERPLPAESKGLGLLAVTSAVTTASLADRRLSLFGPELTMPLLVLKQDALAHNIGAMARYCAEAGVRLAPHGKTTMAPQIVARQIEAGAWGVTAATISQVQVFREFGVERVLLANELTEPAAVGWLAAELAADPGFDCYVYADSLDGVRLLAEGVRTAGVTGPGRCRSWWSWASAAGGPGAVAPSRPRRWPPRSPRPPGCAWPGWPATRAASAMTASRPPWPR